MSARYDTFVILAESLQWDETAIDFTPDIQAWPALGDGDSAQVLGLIAGFCIAESAVSGHLDAFQAAASDDSVAACFRAQARDEHRHARFFDRVAAEVAAVPGAGLAARQDVLRTLVSPELAALFEERLPATARRLAEDRAGLTAAVGLYHMVLEGVVLLAGQNAMFRMNHPECNSPCAMHLFLPLFSPAPPEYWRSQERQPQFSTVPSARSIPTPSGRLYIPR